MKSPDVSFHEQKKRKTAIMKRKLNNNGQQQNQYDQMNGNWDYKSDFKYMYLFFNLKYYPDILILETKYMLSPLII